MPFAPLFAAYAAYGERVNAARYYVAIAPQRENTLSGIYAVQWVVLKHHDIFIPQFSQKRFCRKIFCEEERRAF